MRCRARWSGYPCERCVTPADGRVVVSVGVHHGDAARLVKRIFRPSGDHEGCVSYQVLSVSWRRSLPSALMTKISGPRLGEPGAMFFGSELRVAFADPSDPDAVGAVQEHMAFPIQPAVAELSDIDAIWRSIRY